VVCATEEVEVLTVVEPEAVVVELEDRWVVLVTETVAVPDSVEASGVADAVPEEEESVEELEEDGVDVTSAVVPTAVPETEAVVVKAAVVEVVVVVVCGITTADLSAAKKPLYTNQMSGFKKRPLKTL